MVTSRGLEWPLLRLRPAFTLPSPLPPASAPPSCDGCTGEAALSGENAGSCLRGGVPRAPLERSVWYSHDLAIDHFSVCGGPLASPKSIDAFWSMYLAVRRRGFGRGHAADMEPQS